MNGRSGMKGGSGMGGSSGMRGGIGMNGGTAHGSGAACASSGHGYELYEEKRKRVQPEASCLLAHTLTCRAQVAILLMNVRFMHAYVDLKLVAYDLHLCSEAGCRHLCSEAMSLH